MAELETCVAELLKQFPTYRILAVVPNGERTREVEDRFSGTAVRAVVPGSQLYGSCYDAVVSEMPASEALTLVWSMEVLPTRLAPGATLYRVKADA